MNILLVEDNPGDVRLTEEALKEGDFYHELELNVVTDGDDALQYLNRVGKYSDITLPDIIFLDLNLPKRDGREVLAEIKQNPILKMIPVVVLTTSEAEQDILNSYELHANCYITKPVDINRFIDVIKSIENFWFHVVKLPSMKH
ncbi:response regulator [Pontibacter sp. G13]|uniref:response regulator n=1 Tax=Pontibacter sp. G13 TaxID=3074898 RepID=UPI00288A9A62|nr:response regulator [Pontibacter sp. G13]WNJ21035.1 response regulator [Pontibacter sp. G13]